MIQTKKHILIFVCVIFTAPIQLLGQNTKVENTKRETLLKAAREIINSTSSCALITLNDNSIPIVRTMEPFKPESDFTIWFGTNAKSRKVQQIQKNSNVTLYYRDKDDTGYVVLYGNAMIVSDQKQKQKRWKPSWKKFYSESREEYLLIKVIPKWMEILSTKRNIMGDSVTWKTPIIKFEYQPKQ